MNRRFLHIINSSKPVIVDFYTDWCFPCKQMPPILKEVKKEFKDRVRVVKVNVDQNPVLASRFKIQSVPTLIVFKEGQPQWKSEGICKTGDLKSAVSDQINKKQ